MMSQSLLARWCGFRPGIGPVMAQAPPLDFSEQVIQRYRDLVHEQDELDRRYARREEEELRALEAAKKEIEDELREERERAARELPGNMPFPEWLDKILRENCDNKVQKRQEDYEVKKMERKKRYDAEKLQQSEKWRDLLPTPSNKNNGVSNLDLTIPEPRPKKPVEIAPPPSILPQARHPQVHPQVHPPRPADMRVMGQQREHLVHVVPSQQPQQYARIDLQQLPRPPVVPSQPAAPLMPQRVPSNGAYMQHNVHQPRPLEAQRPVYQAPPSARLPEHPAPPVTKQRTALPETTRISERRPEAVRAPPQGAYGLPRILPLAEQHQPRPDNEQFKRKAEGYPVPPPPDKRSKVPESNSTADLAITTPPGPPRVQKTISFHEVYQNGGAQYKHFIVEYPTNSRKYYILKCEEHGVHFNTNPLAGAAKHLHSAQHGNMTKERAQAVEILGYHVFDCDENKMQQNNKVVLEAFEGGYKPLNLNQLTKAGRANHNRPGDAAGSPTATSPKAIPAANAPHRGGTRESNQKLFPGITHPTVGELYLAYWPREKRNYAVLMLPLGDLNKSGMQGTLASTGLLDGFPNCYVVDSTTGAWGWAPGYGEGEPYVSKREFPVMYFDGRQSVGWVAAKELSDFNFDDPLWREIPFFREAIDFYAKNRGFQSFHEMRARNEGRDGRFYGRNQHQLQQRVPVTARPPAASLPPTTLPTQSGLVEKSQMNTDSQKRAGTMIPPVEHADLADASSVSDKDSYQASINKGLDSDNDVEMANTESRSTSVSNRGDTQAEQGAPEQVQVLKQPFAQPIPPAIVPPRPVDMARPYSDNSSLRGAVYVIPPSNAPPAVPLAPTSSHQTTSSMPRPANEFAQMIASRALHLQGPERDQPAASASTQSRDFSRPTVARSEIGPSGSGLASTNGNGYHRHVEKVYATSSTPYRTSPSQSPAMSTTALPEPRAENASSQSISRNSSPASLNNILQNPSAQSQAVMARPGPLSQNGPASVQLQHRPLPLDRSGARTASPPMRSPSVLAGFAQTIQGPPSPPLSNSLGIQQHSRSPALEQLERPGVANSPAPSNPPTRTPTPVILKASNDLTGDRWRAGGAESISRSESANTRLPVPQEQRQAGPGPISTSPRPTAESPREPALMTPVTSVNETRSNSPAQARDYGASPAPSFKIESGESYALARVTDNKEVIFDHGEAQGKLLPILVDPQTKTASGSPRPGVELVVDPLKIKQAVVRPSGTSPTASNVTLKMIDGNDRELELVFETWELSVGRIHARRFCRWLKSVNPVLEIDNKQ